MKKIELKLPNLEFLKFSNIYSANFDEFNFKIIPKINLNKFEIFIWFGKNNLDFCNKPIIIKQFILSEKGCYEGQNWINSEFEKFNREKN